MTLTLYINGTAYRSWELDFTALTAKGRQIYLDGNIRVAKDACRPAMKGKYYEFAIEGVMSNFPPEEPVKVAPVVKAKRYYYDERKRFVMPL